MTGCDRSLYDDIRKGTAELGWEPLDERTQRILSQIRAGRKFRDIAEQFGISIVRVSQIRHRAGLPRRHQPAV
ncbi:MAG: hypothetical protein JO159_13155 [Acidobacteria bacterium]|nr:hypothetical protein [Acidobacteriota bacterium]